ncbi:MAG: ParB/RepB/Spo0J family partition protein [Clostridia bacterium]|nr:ParB/RepB/Spo0J family partition protein [Clostridia bacterium]
MAAKKSGLGRGLDSLFLDTFEDENRKGGVQEIKISLIDPKSGQPRKVFDSEALAQLADSIAVHGVLQPILLREIGGDRYQIIAGERRWRASKLVGLTEIPAIVLDKDELAAAQIALVENVQRENLNPIEEAMAFRSLANEYGMTQEELSRQVGKSRSAIANALRLLDLPDEVLKLVSEGALSAGHARTLLGLRDREQILPLAKRAIELGLSVRELEDAVKRANRPIREKTEPEATFQVDYVAELEQKMMQGLGRKVKITSTGSKKLVSLYFEDNEDLEALLRSILGDEFVASL